MPGRAQLPPDKDVKAFKKNMDNLCRKRVDLSVKPCVSSLPLGFEIVRSHRAQIGATTTDCSPIILPRHFIPRFESAIRSPLLLSRPTVPRLFGQPLPIKDRCHRLCKHKHRLIDRLLVTNDSPFDYDARADSKGNRVRAVSPFTSRRI